MLTINPEEQLQVAISDGMGRTVATAVIEPDHGDTPGAPVTWSCVLHDAVVSVIIVLARR